MAARHVLLGLGIVLSGALAVTGAEAAKKKGPAPVAAGCVKAIPPYCAGITSGKNTYALLNANPFIPIGTRATVWGKVNSIGPCGGPAIEVASWKPSKGKCKA